ncbi:MULTISPECIES: hypothetical protein [Sutcliffiella]|uniref:hypothetical protein n=1 Tax=Sutcliffiella TaxID=2837511 RepID=UPI000A5AD10F|nr:MULTISPECIES: hypothetical protein [Sutcliffiella]MED4017168.1 hypothetical protein [Sutcliffiella cohnii]WBL13599.1 hypothetical protein O1A01_16970 [Sutcliffiella sp. NC1]
MDKKKKEPMFQSGELTEEELKGYYGMDPEQSLLSVNFATTENTYLNEHYSEDTKEGEE